MTTQHHRPSEFVKMWRVVGVPEQTEYVLERSSSESFRINADDSFPYVKLALIDCYVNDTY